MKTPNPVGHYVLIEIPEVKETTEGGIILSKDTTKREERASTQGKVIAVGPCAYVGWSGCEKPDIPPHKQWGFDIGDWVEFRKYDGHSSAIEGFDRHRYIPDTHIVGRVDNE